MRHAASVGAFVVTRNRSPLLEQALRSLLNQTHRPDAVWVIDNGSTDGSAEMVSREFGEQVSYCRLENNSGSAGAMWLALRLGQLVGYHWTWIVDDDGRPEPSCLAELMVTIAEEKNVAAAVCMKLDDLGRRVSSYLVWDPVAKRVQPPIEQTGDDAPFDVDYTGTCGLIVPRTTINQAGLPLGDLFNCFEDYDYCARLRRYGRIVVAPRAVVRHPLHAPVWSDGHYWKAYYLIRNALYFRLYGGRTVFPNTKLCGILLLAVREALNAVSSRRWKLRWLGSLAHAVFHGLLGKLGRGPDWICATAGGAGTARSARDVAQEGTNRAVVKAT